MRQSVFLSRLLLSVSILVISVFTRIEAKELSTLLNVIDGDTLKVEYLGNNEDVRLIGIDTPESTINPKAKEHSQRTKKDIQVIISEGKIAKSFTESLVKPGDKIYLEFDTQQRDKYNRLLSYVYLVDGRMLNEEIIKSGYASLLTIPPNVKYQDKFSKAHGEARVNNRGLWSKNTSSNKTPTTSGSETVIFNKKTLIYHNPNCIWAKKCTKNCIKIKKSEAIKKGARPCKVCGE